MILIYFLLFSFAMANHESYTDQNIILTAYEAQISGTVIKNNGEALRNGEVIIQEVGQIDNIISTEPFFVGIITNGLIICD